MLNGEKLAIFDFFEIDTNLPKWKKPEKIGNDEKENDQDRIMIGGWGQVPTMSSISFNSDQIIEQFEKNSIDYLQHLRVQLDNNNLPLLTKVKYYLFFYFTSIFIRKKTKEILTKKTYHSIEEFFATLKNSKLELTKTKDILEKYEKSLIEAQKNGQQSLVEKLLVKKDAIASETFLIEKGITKYVSEDQVVKLYKATDKSKHLKLTYLKNYVRIIPSEVVKLKDKADELKIFDNYVILHYDPFNNSTDLTIKEKKEKIAKAKDPIMFGVIKNSRNLYFIGDWEDQFCNLTLDRMMEILSEKELNLSNESVKSYIDEI